LAHLGAKIALDCGKDYKVVQSLFYIDKESTAGTVANPAGPQVHKSCHSVRKVDELSLNDGMY